MTGKTPRARKNERDRMNLIVTCCGCLPCLLMGFLDVHATIEHVTDRGRRITQDWEQHKFTIGLCVWHHFGHTHNHKTRHQISGERGPSLIWGRTTFEDHFGDEVKVLVPTQDFMLNLFAEQSWQEYEVPRDVARLTRAKWIELNHAFQTAT